MKEVTVNLLCSVLFISIFIVVFFFSYASVMERKVIVQQTQEVVDYFFDDFVILLQNPKVIEYASEIINGLDVDTQNEDARIKNKNETIIESTLMIILLFGTFLSLLIIFVFVKNCNEVNFTKVFIKNVFVLGIVALTEFLFTTFIASKYITFDPNYIKFTLTKATADFVHDNKN